MTVRQDVQRTEGWLHIGGGGVAFAVVGVVGAGLFGAFEVEAFDGQREAGDFVDGGEDAAEAGVAGGDFEEVGHAGEEVFEDAVFAAAEDGVVGTGHAEVGDIGGAGGEDAGVGGGGVGVGAEIEGDFAVEVPAHGDFFGGGFGVEVNDFDFDVAGDFGEHAVHGAEGVIDLDSHVEASHDLEDGAADAGAGGDDAPAFADGGGGKVAGADEAVGLFEEGEDVAFAVGVVAEGAGVNAGGEDFLEDGGRESGAAGGVFGVGDNEVDGAVGDGFGEEFGEDVASGFADDVAEAEDFDGHETCAFQARVNGDRARDSLAERMGADKRLARSRDLG